MKFRVLIIILAAFLFLQGYKYEYHVEPLNASANAADRNNLGVAYMEMGQINHAIAAFKLAIALSPNAPASAAYYNNLGLAYSKVGAYNLARPCFNKAIELNPVFLEYYNNLINLSSKDGSLDAQLEIYKSMAADNPENSYAQFMLGLIYKQKGENDKAVTALKKYVSIEKDNVLSRAAKQMIFELQGEK